MATTTTTTAQPALTLNLAEPPGQRRELDSQRPNRIAHEAQELGGPRARVENPTPATRIVLRQGPEDAKPVREVRQGENRNVQLQQALVGGRGQQDHEAVQHRRDYELHRDGGPDQRWHL